MEVIVHVGYPKTATTFMQQEIFDELKSFECKGKDVKNISNLNKNPNIDQKAKKYITVRIFVLEL